MLTERESQILALLRADPMLPQAVIAHRLGLSRSAVAGHIMRLHDKGAIRGRGYVFGEQQFVAVIGGSNVDIHGMPSSGLKLHDSNPGSVSIYAGGVARNIAENLARLGVDCRLLSAVGTDANGEFLLRRSRAAGIDVGHVVKSQSTPTSSYLSVLDSTGDMHVAVSDMAVVSELTPERLATSEAMLEQAALIFVDTNLSSASLTWLAERFSHKPLFADTVSTSKAGRLLPVLAAIHTLKPSLNEAEAISGISARTNKQLNKMADWFHEQGIARVFITLGDRGVFASAHEFQALTPASKLHGKVQNAGGAGDAFAAALAYAHMQNWDLQKTIDFALAAASVTLRHAATSNPGITVNTVLDELETQNADHPK